MNEKKHPQPEDASGFSRRDFRVTYHDGTPAPGTTFRKLPDPNYRSLPLD